jgi:hypothetical protein
VTLLDPTSTKGQSIGQFKSAGSISACIEFPPYTCLPAPHPFHFRVLWLDGFSFWICSLDIFVFSVQDGKDACRWKNWKKNKIEKLNKRRKSHSFFFYYYYY